MNGIKIAKPNADLIGATPAHMQLDSELETLPIALFGEFNMTVYTGYTIGTPPYIQYEITHGLGYVPMFRGWEVITVSGVTTYQSIPTGIDSSGFITAISADEQVIYVRADFTAFTFAGSTYRKRGYVYVYEKEFKGLPT